MKNIKLNAGTYLIQDDKIFKIGFTDFSLHVIFLTLSVLFQYAFFTTLFSYGVLRVLSIMYGILIFFDLFLVLGNYIWKEINRNKFYLVMMCINFLYYIVNITLIVIMFNQYQVSELGLKIIYSISSFSLILVLTLNVIYILYYLKKLDFDKAYYIIVLGLYIFNIFFYVYFFLYLNFIPYLQGMVQAQVVIIAGLEYAIWKIVVFIVIAIALIIFFFWFIFVYWKKRTGTELTTSYKDAWSNK